jgi:antitoxin HigA-1
MIEQTTWNIHPGEVLREEFLKPMGVSVYRLAKETHVPAIRMNDIVNEKRSITVDTALRLAKFFGTTPQFWMNMQMNYEIRQALQEHKDDISSIHQLRYEATEKNRLEN